mmetsp:Transcript_12681/g.22813  ORF Transcript_12681/g.22813 Transcript_12681/m.22813 type:complete len:177 (-) Transcript_12681:39-569(-)
MMFQLVRSPVLRVAASRLRNPQIVTPRRNFCEEAEQDPLVGTATHQNLKTAFVAEAMSVVRFEYFAQKADAEGQLQAAQTLRAAAASSLQQAFGHMEFLDYVGDPATDAEIGDTQTNLSSAIAGEQDEGERMYPEWSQTAADEGHEAISEWLSHLSVTSKRNANSLAEALELAAQK